MYAETLTFILRVQLGVASGHESHWLSGCAGKGWQVADQNVIPLFPRRPPKRTL